MADDVFVSIGEGRVLCTVCNRDFQDTEVVREMHVRGTKHMNAMMKRALAKHGDRPKKWPHDMR